MKSPNKTLPNPPTNILRDQLKAQRRELITQVMALRDKRSALKGVKGVGEQWVALGIEIDAVQDKIDLLSRSMGLPVKDRHRTATGMPQRTNRLFRANRSGRKDNSIANPPAHHQRPSPEGRVNLTGNHADTMSTEVFNASYLQPTKPSPVGKTDLKHRQDNDSLMIIDDEDLAAWDRFNSDVDGDQ